eukprot:FR736397.1.p1 GENE.FR736397.1~~FR736397.1.p1  ORF type:complete len:163 (+),score=8.17 FR736397.1:468-956(+)
MAMSDGDVRKKARALFGEAGVKYMQIMTSANHDDDAAQRVGKLANYATRLGRLAGESAGHRTQTRPTTQGWRSPEVLTGDVLRRPVIRFGHPTCLLNNPPWWFALQKPTPSLVACVLVQSSSKVDQTAQQPPAGNSSGNHTTRAPHPAVDPLKKKFQGNETL